MKLMLGHEVTHGNRPGAPAKFGQPLEEKQDGE